MRCGELARGPGDRPRIQLRHPGQRQGDPAAPGASSHRITGAQGADRTGLATLIEMTAVSGAADAFVTVALAGTIFFSTSVDQARGRVVLFLIITMAPFAVLAPFIGPALDRIQQGRRFVLAGTMLTRGLLCYAMSANVANSVTLLPAAFGILVLQKAGGVVKASVTPRLLPADLTLVNANARSGLISLAASTVAAGLAAGVQFAGGAAWTLRVGTLIYLAAMVLALRLPEQIDVPAAPPSPDPRQPGSCGGPDPRRAREARPRQDPARARRLALGHGRRLLPVRAATTRPGRPVRVPAAPRCRSSRARSRPPRSRRWPRPRWPRPRWPRAVAYARQRRPRRRRGDDGQRRAARLLRLHPVPAGVPAAQRGPRHRLRPPGVAQLRPWRARPRPDGRQPRAR